MYNPEAVCYSILTPINLDSVVGNTAGTLYCYDTIGNIVDSLV